MGSSTGRRRARRARFQRRTLPGAPPGTIVPDPNAPRSQVRVMAFGAEGFVEQELDDVSRLPALMAQWPVTWVDVDGVGDTAVIGELGNLFDLHRLALEDVVHVHQRAKAEAYPHCYFVVARMPRPGRVWETEQISFFFGERFVLTFQEQPGGDCLEAVRTRIRTGWGRARCARPDALFYALLDVIVDHYFPLVEDCGERLDELEGDVLSGPRGEVMSRIHRIKRDLLMVRRAMWPLRDAINALLRDANPLVSQETRIYLRDVHDHTIQIVELVESYRDVASGLTDVYLSTVSQRTNEIVKVLTIISTIFIPLTFIVGIYGMNFHYMPELAWWWFYPAVWAIMAAVALGQVGYFYRRGWIGPARARSIDVRAGDDPPPS